MYTVTNINQLPIIEIENFLSSEEVSEILSPRKQQFEKSTSHYPDYYRNNDRLVEDNKELSSILFDRLKYLNIQDIPTDTNLISINDRIRFCRYQKDQLFSKHQDGVYYPDSKSESKFSFLLYLNGQECFENGETEFYNSKKAKNPIKTIIPKKGKLVVFDHQIWHKGAKVNKGNKYILRSDIIIKKNRRTAHHDGYIWNLLKLNKETFLSCGRDKKIKLWNKNLELQKTIEVHTKSILKIIRFNKDEYISCSRDFTIKKWNLSGKVISSMNFNEMILNLHLLENNRIIAVGTSGLVYILNSGLTIIKTINVHNTWIWDVSVIENNKFITCSEDGSINLTNLTSEKTVCIHKHDQPLFCLNTKGKDTILVGAKDGTLIHFFTKTKKIHKVKVHDDIIRSIKYCNQYIISCGEDNKVISMDQKSYETKEVFKSSNFMQDIIVLQGNIYGAGYNGVISISKI